MMASVVGEAVLVHSSRVLRQIGVRELSLGVTELEADTKRHLLTAIGFSPGDSNQ
jgi:hypothetical protein